LFKKNIIGFKDYTVARIIFLLAIIYLGILASSIQPEVFFQGDGGVKFLVINMEPGIFSFKRTFCLFHAQRIPDFFSASLSDHQCFSV